MSKVALGHIILFN